MGKFGTGILSLINYVVCQRLITYFIRLRILELVSLIKKTHLVNECYRFIKQIFMTKIRYHGYHVNGDISFTFSPNPNLWPIQDNRFRDSSLGLTNMSATSSG